MKDQLESVVFQMYRAGVRCSEAVLEFQRVFILTVLKDQIRANASRTQGSPREHPHFRGTAANLFVVQKDTRSKGQLAALRVLRESALRSEGHPQNLP